MPQLQGLPVGHRSEHLIGARFGGNAALPGTRCGDPLAVKPRIVAVEGKGEITRIMLASRVGGRFARVHLRGYLGGADH